jgi:AcrR family transcriptional regulator
MLSVPMSHPPLPKTARGRQRREQILRAAERVIGRKGYSDASIADITAEAQTALGTFYIYFGSKEDVFTQLVAEMGRMTRRVLAGVAAESCDRLEAERRGLLAFLEFVQERPELYRIVEEARFVNPPAYRAYFTTFAAAYREGLEAAAGAGEIAAGDAEVRAWALMGMAKTLGERYVLWSDGTPLDHVADEAFRMIRDGLGKGPG